MRRIGFLVDHRLYGSADSIRAETPFVNFLAGFREHFDEVVLISRLFDDFAEREPAYPLPQPGLSVVPLPAYPRIADLYTHPLRYWPTIDRVLRRTLPKLDALWLNYGHPVSLRALTHVYGYGSRRPRCFAVLRGAYEVDARLRMANGVAGAIAESVAKLNLHAFSRRARREGLVCFAYGDRLVERLVRQGVKARRFIDSLVTEADLLSPPPPDRQLAANLLYVGRLSHEKGVDLLLRALKQRNGDKAALSLRVVGSGPQELDYRALTQQLGLTEYVRFDGHIPFGRALFQRYRSSQLMVIPSRTEGLPKTAYEAMAFGCPVMATAVGGLPEIVGRDESRGFLVRPESVPELASSIDNALGDKQRLVQMREAARQFAAGITLERQVERMVREAGIGDITKDGTRRASVQVTRDT
jgi:glycosyltransferase involved in cell wall biosynthesis